MVRHMTAVRPCSKGDKMAWMPKAVSLCFERTVGLARDLIEAWHECVASGKTPEARDEVDHRAGVLITDLVENYHGAVDGEMVQRAFSGFDLDHVTADVPQGIIPVIVVRAVLHRHKVAINPRNVANWPTFVQRYGKYIIAV